VSTNAQDANPKRQTARPRIARSLALLLLPFTALGVLAASCGDDNSIRVFAAVSLADVMPRIIEQYEETHPGIDVELRLGGSQALATQIEEGAPADLFISANPVQAQRLVERGLLDDAGALVANRLVVAVGLDSELNEIEQLAAPGVRVAVGAPDVPAGALTATALGLLPADVAAAIRDNVVTEDPNVRIVLSRVELGEADAAFVYHTDLAAAPRTRAIELPAALGVPRNDYVAGLVAGGDARAVDLLAFLRGDEAQALLAEAGFLPVDER
jgi:molybdate transport system substrate-binding protein